MNWNSDKDAAEADTAPNNAKHWAIQSLRRFNYKDLCQLFVALQNSDSLKIGYEGFEIS